MKIKTYLLCLIVLLISTSYTSAQSLAELYESGKKAFYSDKFDEANEYFTQILTLNSDNFENCYYKGLVYGINFDNEKAAVELTNAIAYDPESSDAYLKRGIVFEKQEKYSEAIQDYSSAIKLNKKDSEAYFNRGSLYQDMKQYDDAIFDFTKTIKLNPNDDIATYNRGLLYKELKQNDKAIEDFEKTISIDITWEKTLRPVIEQLQIKK